jgi:hypothetical protein
MLLILRNIEIKMKQAGAELCQAQVKVGLAKSSILPQN